VTPDRFRELVSGVLIVGVVVSASLIAFGFAASLVVGWDGSLRGFPVSTLPPTDFSSIATGLVELRPVAIVQAGLVVLIATPVVRVVASVVAFTLEGDRLYAAITLGVLAILLFSLVVLR
jgi:uncharacterized membrane protein